MNPST